MTARPAIPCSEAGRLDALHALMVIDSGPEEVFDALARAASVLCGTAVALVTLIDAQRQWFKANVGAPDYTQTSRDIAFCDHTIRSDALMEVPDTTLDERFAENPLVCGSMAIRFYAGAPLLLKGGERVGSLCVLDRRPMKLDERQKEALVQLAGIAAETLQMRRDLITRALSARSEFEAALAESEALHRSLVEGQEELVALSDRAGRLTYANAAYARHFGRSMDGLVGSDLYAGVSADSLDDVRCHIERVFATGASRHHDFRTVDATGHVRWVAWTDSLRHDSTGRPLLHSVGRDVTERRNLEAALSRQQQFVRSITDALPMQVAYLDQDARYRFSNLPHSRRLGVTQRDVLGHSRPELVDELQDDRFFRRLTAAMAGKSQYFKLETVRNGAPSFVETQLIPDFDDEGVVRGIFETGLDVTARIVSETAARELLAVFDHTPSFVLQSDADGRLTYVNRTARKAIGMTLDQEVIGLPVSSIIELPEGDRLSAAVRDVIAATGMWVGETRVKAAAGAFIPVSHTVIGHRNAQGVIDRYSTLMRDITTDLEAKHEQQRQAATLRSAAEAIPAMVAVVGADRRYRFINGALARWFGPGSRDVVGSRMEDVLDRLHYQQSSPWIERALAGERVVFEKEPGEHNPDQHLSIAFVPMLLDECVVDGFVIVATDVSHHKREEKRLRHLTQRDPLTGLLNRAGLESYMELARSDSPHDISQLGLLYIDLDHFKPVNDVHGHLVGDELLKLVGSRLSSLVRPTDAVVRLGGDEFAIVLPGMRDMANLALIADKVVSRSKEEFVVGDIRLRIGASVGLALGMKLKDGPVDLLKRADAMLYKAKAAGKGCSRGA